MVRIAIYGKGGIGKSTVSANVACALAALGHRVLLVGCDPKADSTRTVCGKRIGTILNLILSHPDALIRNLLVRGYRGVDCIETGGPAPGDGCAGRGVASALRALREQGLLTGENYDVVIYDVLGDVVCGGFSLPLKEGFADRIYIVTACDFMALYAANNICHSIAKYSVRSGSVFGGIIYNERGVVNDSAIVRAFAERLSTRVVGSIPSSTEIIRAELTAKTIMEYAPNSETAKCFEKLARHLLREVAVGLPTPMSEEQLDAFLFQYGDRGRCDCSCD
jgi:nitrogenase iron protein NifH